MSVQLAECGNFTAPLSAGSLNGLETIITPTNCAYKLSLFSSLFFPIGSVDLGGGNLHKNESLLHDSLPLLLQYSETTIQIKQERTH